MLSERAEVAGRVLKMFTRLNMRSYRTLLVLFCVAKGPRTIHAIRKDTKLNAASVSEAIKELQEQGFATTEVLPRDKRVRLLRATPAGIKHLQKELEARAANLGPTMEVILA